MNLSKTSGINKLNKIWVDEYHESTRFGLRGKKILEEESEYQKITIFDSDRYGKALLLDHCWMCAENQEKEYHEAIVHPALTSAEKIEKILIIGGGDGGTAKECLKYNELKQIDMVEIDQKVIQLSKKYLPCIGGGCWEDSRLNVIIGDGIKWVKNTKEDYYDVIIIDSSDPKGAAKGLFNQIFFRNCHRILRTNGVFSAQTESPESFQEIHINAVKLIRSIFKYADPLYGNMPLYPSGYWSWTFASKKSQRYLHPIPERSSQIVSKCNIWSPRWQKGSFEAIPAQIERELKT
ncbi:polyamine aminopropyltransferase [Prochlorococcus marinus]|uniref:polyamine aminopropyltransferase n=1 Tax=Prochlorococcus marinus TaxID=1219 RepID=UPI0022B4A9D2|nr:polyamine aminopropyltransferase [Prochlorococcus marinus]